ncbi:MAG: hypothetical protein KGK44_08675, partial [Gammaproteobacteria bacterium]|nr:hypothetical protein [Gammaproteobacteria bacterium]
LAFNSIAVDPMNSAKLDAATVLYGMYTSKDSGNSWIAINGGLQLSGSAVLAVSPQNPQEVFLGNSTSGFGVSTDGGYTWSPENAGIPPLPLSGIDVRAFAFKPNDASSLYAAALTQGFLVSTDSAQSWTQANNGLPQDAYITAIAADPSNPDTVYAALELSNGGLFKSTDGGASWNRLTSAPNDYVFTLAVDPANPQILFMSVQSQSNIDQFEESTDGGASWAPIGANLPGGALIENIVFDPNPLTTLYISAYNAGVYKSIDGGNTWTTHGPTSTDGYPALAMDPVNPNTLYAGTLDHGVYQTTDGGNTWRQVNSGLDNNNIFGSWVTAMAVAHDTAHTVYLATFDGKVYSHANAAVTPPPPKSSGGSGALGMPTFVGLLVMVLWRQRRMTAHAV